MVVVVGRDRFACGHRIICFNYKISITTSCALTSSMTSTSRERKSVTLQPLSARGEFSWKCSSVWTSTEAEDNMLKYTEIYICLIILLEILNIIYQETPSFVCSPCEGRADCEIPLRCLNLLTLSVFILVPEERLCDGEDVWAQEG